MLWSEGQARVWLKGAKFSNCAADSANLRRIKKTTTSAEKAAIAGSMILRGLIYPLYRIKMQLRNREIWMDLFLAIAVLLISWAIFDSIIYLDILTDIQTHVLITINVFGGDRPIPVNFLYYLSIYVISGFQTKLGALLGTSVFVLALAVTIKFLITKKIIHDYIAGSAKKFVQPVVLIALASFMLIFVFSLPGTGIAEKGWFFLGQRSPNVWHNSTTIFTMPFALLLFWMSYKQLMDPHNKRILIILLLVIVNIVAKPHFFFVFAVVYPMLLINRIGINKKFWLNVSPVIIGVFILGAQFYLLTSGARLNIAGGVRQIAIDPFLVWSAYSSNIPISIVASYIFPLLYISLYPKHLLQNLFLKYAALCSIVALCSYSLFIEKGRFLYHGNFGWTTVLCNYILFMVVSTLVIENVACNGKWGRRDIVIALLLLLHFIFGLVYLGKMFLTGEFY